VELGQQEGNLRKLGLKSLAVSYDSEAIWRHFMERKKLVFPFLADSNSTLIDSFGLRNKAVNIDFMQGIPHPGVFLLDSKGRITAKYFEDDYRERFTIASILNGSFGQNAAIQGEFTGKRIKVVTSASTSVVKGGQRIRLTLTATLGPGLHVYAPGAPEDFIPVSWTIEGAKAALPTWPKADKNFQYSGTFAASREITFPAQLKNEELLIKGVLRYQSCTDTVCYPPENVAVEWKFVSESHDRERVPAEIRRK